MIQISQSYTTLVQFRACILPFGPLNTQDPMLGPTKGQLQKCRMAAFFERSGIMGIGGLLA